MMQQTANAPHLFTHVLKWLRDNLFSSWFNSFLTLACLYLLYATLPPLIQWAIIDADWVGTSREDCDSGGACWVFISVRASQFFYGFYPDAEIWRVNLVLFIFIGLALPLFFKNTLHKLWLAGFLLFIYPLIAFEILYGERFGLPVVETALWGGLMLTLTLAFIGMVVSLPLGILLALGRRSSMPIVRTLCVIFIEFWRGVPLITVLFMSSVMLPLFLPEGMNFDKLFRAAVGIVLFESAYMAEVVRGGLQAIPKGQYEAAASLGLGYWRTMFFVILPQALKLVIPGIVNTLIALLKDTSLILIIGLFDLLGMIKAALNDPYWLGYSVEGFLFGGFIYWLLCFSMSRYSQHLERKLQTSHKR
ncbi:amine acid ABC transporter, permease protein, 3-TM region, His/Glu/Gln/Arg/opine family [Beggiatoa alba B18LD]|uniref:Amine acid ABC transporter, permease protein, 3-TM region, His/Glu/Gln/Arg/opine family n=1 Tax=Beggiatoa alba B18LD TaxID=395493 RepID=I3CHZ1_9GAMM|nr:amino acid ABC transporter permease [Beggiatoa alba]EIJ43234.1 amine acid ABC transporter, permease protein, 3-TM region, His/Glu/Gln/Arg/opine family [Beggiatoa alba B18LD]